MSAKFVRSGSGHVMSGHDDNRNRSPSASTQSDYELFAVHSGHHQVDQNQYRLLSDTQFLNGINTVDSGHDPVTIYFQEDFDHFADVGIVVNDHHERTDIGFHEDLTNGNSTMKVEPALG